MKTILHSVNGRTFEIQFALRTVASHDLILAWPSKRAYVFQPVPLSPSPTQMKSRRPLLNWLRE